MQVIVTPTALEGVWIIDTRVFADARGFFLETYTELDFHAVGLTCKFVQDNHSRSNHGVLRGFHYQDLQEPQAKLVRCSRGKIVDVVVDLRVGSPTFSQWLGVELSDSDMRQLFVPVGFGHGFAALSEVADVQYKTTGFYNREAEGAVLWNDPEIGVNWRRWLDVDPLVSEKDQLAPRLSEYARNPAFRYGETRPW